MGERNITYFDSNPDLIGMADLYPDITYSTAQGQELKLTLLTPWRDRDHESAPPRHPLIVFVQGSAWTFPNVNYEIPQLAAWARAGYVVATVTHRNRLEGHPFPAFLEDVKTSIRFLRKNADTYGLDPHRVCIWGTSSGGNTALLVGLTGNDPAFKTQEYPEESDGVQLVIDCFGPTDMIHFGTATVPPRRYGCRGFHPGRNPGRFSGSFRNPAGHGIHEPLLSRPGRRGLSALPASARRCRSCGSLRSESAHVRQARGLRSRHSNGLHKGRAS